MRVIAIIFYSYTIRNGEKYMPKNFTLSEILITLTITGIVAALTVPVIIGFYKERETITKVKSAYSLLSQAYKIAYIENGGDLSTWSCYNQTTGGYAKCITDELSTYLKISKKVLDYTDNIPYTLNMQENTINKTSRMNSLLLSNGFIIKIPAYSNCILYSSWDVNYIEKFSCPIYVDINGDKGPNALGKDVFGFKIHKDKIEGWGNKTEPYYTFERMCNKSRANDYWDGGANGSACTAWILENDNMDYLHCSGLSWKGKRKCF